LTAAAEVVESFYLLVSISMVVVMLLATLLQGALRTELDRYARGREWIPTASPSPLDTATRGVTHLSNRILVHGPRPTLLLAGVLFVLAVGSATRVESDLAREDFLQSSMPTKAAHEASEKYFGTSRVGYVVFTGDVENPELLLKMKRLREGLKGEPRIEQVVGKANTQSVMDLIRKLGIPVKPETDVRKILNQVLANERTANYVLDMSYAEAANRLVRKDGERYDGLLMRFFVRGDAGSAVRAGCQAVSDQIAALEIDQIPGVVVEIGGGDVTLGLEAVHYQDAMVRSFFMSLAGNFLVLAFAWRRVIPALLAMTPLVLATALVLGVMPVFGVMLNPINLSIGAIVIGLGIDYPIHIIERFDEEVRVSGLAPSDAARKALDTTGPHILAGMLTTSVGFCAACVLLLPLSQSFGLLTGAAVAFVYFSSILALPGLLVWLHTRKS
jgi:predicted RND superfamily exporter protein